MLLGRCSEGPKGPNIGAEDFLQHLGMDAVIALRPLADREKRHVVETKLMERLGIADEMKSRTKLVDGVPVAELVAKGEAEIGMQQINVILPIAGIYWCFIATVVANSKRANAIGSNGCGTRAHRQRPRADAGSSHARRRPWPPR
jgi:hypothetical protein